MLLSTENLYEKYKIENLQFKIDDNIKEDLIFEKRAEELSVKDFIYLTNLISNGNI